jgi:hypothetical protein
MEAGRLITLSVGRGAVTRCFSEVKERKGGSYQPPTPGNSTPRCHILPASLSLVIILL